MPCIYAGPTGTVGTIVGVGVIVGLNVICCVGVAIGVVLGVAIGVIVGAMIGDMFGVSVGNTVGTGVMTGVCMGVIVGAMLGITRGVGVGMTPAGLVHPANKMDSDNIVIANIVTYLKFNCKSSPAVFILFSIFLYIMHMVDKNNLLSAYTNFLSLIHERSKFTNRVLSQMLECTKKIL